LISVSSQDLMTVTCSLADIQVILWFSCIIISNATMKKRVVFPQKSLMLLSDGTRLVGHSLYNDMW